MIAIAAGLMALAIYTQNKSRQDANNAPANSPAAHAATTTAPAPEAAPATKPAPTMAPAAAATIAPPPSSQPTTQRPPGDQWIYEGEGVNRKFTFGSLDPNEGYAFGLDLVNQGAAIYTAKLADYYTTVEDKHAAKSAGTDHQAYLDRVGTDGLQGHYSLLNPVPRNVGQDARTAHDLDEAYKRHEPVSFAKDLRMPMATRWVTLEYGENDKVDIPIEAMRWYGQEVKNPPAGQKQFVFKLTLVQPAWDAAKGAWNGDKGKPYLELTKTYTITEGAKPGEIQYDKRPYSIRVTLSAKNLSSDTYKLTIDQGGATGVPRDDIRQDFRRLDWARLEADNKIQIQKRPADPKKPADTENLGKTTDEKPLIWVGQTNKFFSSLLYLMPKSSDVLAPKRAATWYEEMIPETSTSKTFYTGLRLEMSLAAAKAKGDSDTAELDFFVGPKITELFHETPLYDKLDYAGSIDIGSSCCGMSFCTFDWLSKFIMSFLEILAKYVTFGNYGVAIIVLVIIVRLLLHPLTKKSQVSMSKMQKLAPKMKEIQEKYKNDKDTLNREMLKHSKEQAGVFLGCLPMLLQLPIWIALYSGLQADASLRHAAFLPFWITDLAGQDAIMRFSTPIEIPFLVGMMGPIVSLNLLPLLLTVAMYFQAKLTPTPSTAATPEQEAQQKMQQRMMRVMTPAMMLLFFYNAPAGLTLYIMTSTASGVIEQMVIRKHIRERDEALVGAQTEIVVPGKISRDSRQKKPKGPFWTKRG